MSETTSIRSSQSRASTFLNRPHIAPMGPRTRQSSLNVSHLMENGLSSPLQTLDFEDLGAQGASTSTSRPALPLSPTSPVSSPHSDLKSLAAVSEEPSSPESAPAYIHETPPASTSASTSQTQASIAPRVIAVATPPPKLVPPPAIKFETTSVPWKGLPLEAALWTVDSQELQNVVSRAIRSSASESFIRLLTVENLDTVLPAELERLDSLKAVTQSKYRFLVHRRTMLFQALNSTSLGRQKDGDDGVSVVSRLASQLADTIAECDKRLEEVLKINDQMAQINKLIDVHWASALAIALRKLNGSYARRTKDLIDAKERITQLEAELEDAWKEAEKMARELDDYEEAIAADDTEAIIETAEIVPVPKSPMQTRRASIPMTPTLMTVTLRSPAQGSTTPLSPLSPVSPHFGFPPPVHLKAKDVDAEDVPDTVSIRSTRSTRSTKSTRSHRSTTHTTSVHAAKKRSHRASQGSLRLNTSGHARKHSAGGASAHPRTPYEDQPPVPELPLQFAAAGVSAGLGMGSQGSVMLSSAANASSTLMHFDTRLSPYLRRQASLDTLRTGGGNSTRAQENAQRGRAADDLYVRSQGRNQNEYQYQYQYQYQNQHEHERQYPQAASFDSEIEVVPRTPPHGSTSFASMFHSKSHPAVAPRPPPKDPAKTIPSMWMNVDAVKNASQAHPQPSRLSASSPISSPISPSGSGLGSAASGSAVGSAHQPHPPPSAYPISSASERSESHGFLQRHSTTYSKLCGLTKRYSVSLPLFSNTKAPRPTTSRRSG